MLIFETEAIRATKVLTVLSGLQKGGSLRIVIRFSEKNQKKNFCFKFENKPRLH